MPPGWYGEPHINVMKARVFSKEAISHGQVIVLKKKEKDSYVQQSFTLNHGTPDVKRQYVLMFEYSAKGHVRRMAPN